jgi:hypothetical protein
MPAISAAQLATGWAGVEAGPYNEIDRILNITGLLHE